MSPEPLIVSAAACQKVPSGGLIEFLHAWQVQYREEYKSFTHFLTSVCAIVGGVFTVSGLIDSFIYHGQQVSTHGIVKDCIELFKQLSKPSLQA